jgi:hypothetical protein
MNYYNKKLKKKEIEKKPSEIEAPKCMFCGHYPTHMRSVMINQIRKEVKLCEYCYYEKTLGSIVKKLTKGE